MSFIHNELVFPNFPMVDRIKSNYIIVATFACVFRCFIIAHINVFLHFFFFQVNSVNKTPSIHSIEFPWSRTIATTMASSNQSICFLLFANSMFIIL